MPSHPIEPKWDTSLAHLAPEGQLDLEPLPLPLAPPQSIMIEPAVVDVPRSDRVAKERQKPLFTELPDSQLPQVHLLDSLSVRQETVSPETLEMTSRLIEKKLKDFVLAYAQKDPEEKAILKNIYNYGSFRDSSNTQLLPIRQLELYKDRSKFENDAAMNEAEKKAKLAEIDKRLAELNAQLAQATK
jgi:hypothetical protein